MQRRTFLKRMLAGGLVAAASPTGVWARVANEGTGPVRVYLIVVDGLRADEVPLMPQLHALSQTGTFYPQGRAEMVAETTTNHMSMLTGMRATRHGMPANTVATLPVRPSDEPRYTKADSILTLMRRQAPDLVSATIGAKTYVADLAKHDRTADGETDATYTNTPLLPVTLDSAPDEEIGTEAVRVSRELDPDFLFVNLGDVDRVGHVDETGGASDGQAPAFRITTLLRADAQLRSLVGELQSSGRWEHTVFIVTADHAMDWSRRDQGINLAPLFEADDLLRGEVLAAMNGGASLYALRSPDEPRALERLARMRTIAAGVHGVRDVLYIRPNPLDGGARHWVGRVYPHWGLGGDFAGDLLVTVEEGYRLGHSTSAPAAFANPIPGNHGHPATLPIPVVVAGGWEGVNQAVAEAPAGLSPTDEHPGQARNIDLVPTAAWLLGLHPPPGGFDGRVLDEPFSTRPPTRVAVRNVASMPVVARIAGDDRYATAVALSALAHAAGVDTVVVASGEQFADALAVTPLAIDRGAPILLSPARGLPDAVAEEVGRLGARRAIIAGGEAALGEQVAVDLTAAGVEDVVRIGGANRYDTARLLALELGVADDNRQVVLATGTSFADALAAGPVAAAGHPRTPEPRSSSPLADITGGSATGPRPLLLTRRDRLPPETLEALAALAVDRVLIAGGPGAVSTAVEQTLRDAGVVVERIAGTDRYDTAARWVERGVREGAFTDDLYLVTGAGFADGLAAGAAVGRLGGSLVIAPPRSLAQTPATRDLLDRRADEFVRVNVVGGTSALSAGLAEEVVALIRARRTR
jgi:ectonucleotide pyrophosphatase/phosphodiesterase family member 5